MTSPYAWNDHPLAPPWARPVAGVPRRVGIGGVMLLVTMATIVFALLKTFHASTFVFCFVCILLLGVAGGQVLLFGGRRPRAASVLVGAVLTPVTFLVQNLFTTWGSARGDFSWELIQLAVLCSIPTGMMYGWIAGTLVAGIFLVRRSIGKTPEESDATRLELRPFAEDDIDTLIEWTRSRRLFDSWAGATLSYPLDRRQILDRLADTEGERPRRRMFMAVCPITRRQIGYVELDRVDPETRSASVGLALVIPADSERWLLSVALLSALKEVAFGEMQLHWIDTLVPSLDSTTRACYREVGFEDKGELLEACRVAGERRFAVQLTMVDPQAARPLPIR